MIAHQKTWSLRYYLDAVLSSPLAQAINYVAQLRASLPEKPYAKKGEHERYFDVPTLILAQALYGRMSLPLAAPRATADELPRGNSLR